MILGVRCRFVDEGDMVICDVLGVRSRVQVQYLYRMLSESGDWRQEKKPQGISVRTVCVHVLDAGRVSNNSVEGSPNRKIMIL